MRRPILLITGASGTLGRAILNRFQKFNYVQYDIIAITHTANVEQCYKNIKVDLTKPVTSDFWEELYPLLKERKIAGLIWAAGLYHREEFNDPNFLKGFQNQYNINCHNLLEMAKTLHPYFEQEKGAHIITISSMLSKRSTDTSFSYGATKGMQNILVQKLAYELAKYNIQVNSLNPGLFKSRMSEDVWLQKEKLDKLRANIPLGHFVEIKELVNFIDFLLSGSCPSLTGQNIMLEGGNLLCFPNI